MFMIPTKRIEATIYFWNIPNAGQPTQFIYGIPIVGQPITNYK